MSFFWRLSCQAPFNSIEKFADVIEPHVLSVGWFEGPQENVWILEATVRQQPDETLLKKQLQEAAEQLNVTPPALTIEKIADENWLEQTWKNFPPLTIDKFYIYGSHAKGDIPEGLIGLEINAATAFGSGEHETTTACLQTLGDFYRQGLTFHRSLDMGCGSGILAMAIAKLWETPVLAVDNDPESVKVTQQNIRMNDCEPYITTLCNEGFDGNSVQSNGPFDLIVANILAGPLCEMAQEMVKNIQPQGRLVLSGLLSRQIEEVTLAYEKAGAQVLSIKKVEDWVAITLTK